MSDDPVTVAERYNGAIESTNLRVELREQGAVDLLMAAGWSDEMLGARLLRLRREFDKVRSEHQRAERAMRSTETILARKEAAARAEDKQSRTDAAQILREQAEAIRETAVQSAVKARLLILVQLKTLEAAKEHLGRFAIAEATRVRFAKPDHAALVIAGRALDAWLDPKCAACDGRGHSGGYDGPKMICRGCSGSGNRKSAVGWDDEDRRFAGRLLACMEEAVGNCEKGMRKLLRD